MSRALEQAPATPELARRRRLVAILAVVALAATSCHGGYVAVEPIASGYSVQRYVNYAPVIVYNVRNPSTVALTRVVLYATCVEDQFESLKQKYQSNEVYLAPGGPGIDVTLAHVDGWPYFTDFRVSCSFSASNHAWPAEPWVVNLGFD